MTLLSEAFKPLNINLYNFDLTASVKEDKDKGNDKFNIESSIHIILKLFLLVQ